MLLSVHFCSLIHYSLCSSAFLSAGTVTSSAHDIVKHILFAVYLICLLLLLFLLRLSEGHVGGCDIMFLYSAGSGCSWAEIPAVAQSVAIFYSPSSRVSICGLHKEE